MANDDDDDDASQQKVLTLAKRGDELVSVRIPSHFFEPPCEVHADNLLNCAENSGDASLKTRVAFHLRADDNDDDVHSPPRPTRRQ